MDRMPLPQPRSSTGFPGAAYRSSPARHSWVEAWLPVPKVRPGFRYSAALPGGTGSSRSHSGTIYSRSPTLMGL